jgi:hypothetical protein
MKKTTLMLGLVLLFICSTGSFAKNRTLSKGFGINMVIGHPLASFGLSDDAVSPYKYKTMWGLQLESRWYIAPTEVFGAGIMTKWLDFTMAARGGTDASSNDWGRATLDFSFLELGPIATIALSDAVAIDAYYNLKPTVLSSAYLLTYDNGNDLTKTLVGFGFSHAIGTAFRFKVLNIGVEYVVGKINCDQSETGDYAQDNLPSIKCKTNSLRFFVGVKF